MTQKTRNNGLSDKPETPVSGSVGVGDGSAVATAPAKSMEAGAVGVAEPASAAEGISQPPLPTPPPMTSTEQKPKRRYFASLFPGPDVPLPEEFALLVRELECKLGFPMWFLIQNHDGKWSDIDGAVYKAFQSARGEIEQDKPVGLLLESPGGSAHCAFYIARLFQRRTNQFTVIVPQYAKSAATLLALGASNLILGRDAELGPLDVQMFDPEREDFDSALNAVQSLERLNAFSITAIDQTMQLLTYRTKKKTDTLLPIVLDYVTTFVRPLLEKIDTVDFTKKSRELKVAEQYAVRLMKANYPYPVAERIARQLVERYPTHGFIIDRDEAEAHERISPTQTFGLGLQIQTTSPEVEKIMERLLPFMDQLVVAGRIREV